MRTIQLNIPENVNLKDFDLSMIIAAKLYEDAILSAGEAAQMLGLSMRAFIERGRSKKHLYRSTRRCS